MKVICGVCTSVLNAKGWLDVTAPSLVVVRCPVCNAPITLATGWPVPTKYTSFDIVEYHKPTKLWAEIATEKPGYAEIVEKVPAGGDETIYKDFSVGGGLKDSLSWATDVITTPLDTISKKYGGPIMIAAVIAILVLVVMIKRK